MNLKHQVLMYLQELISLIKSNYVVIISFVLLSILLEFITIPFLSIFLLIFLMFYLSKTTDFKPGKWKIFNFILFFLLIIVSVLLFITPSVIFLMTSNTLPTEDLGTSILLNTSIQIGTLLSLLFIFIPFRIFDANDNIFKASKYSYILIKNNLFIFLMLVIFLFALNYVSTGIKHIDYYIYLIDVICMGSLYKLHVKNSLNKDIL